MSQGLGFRSHPSRMKTEAVSLTEATHLQVKDEDATDSADIVTQAYVEKYSVTITPTAWMKLYGVKATLIVEYIVKTDPGAGTVTVKTLVDAGDADEKANLNIAAGKQTAVHTDIADFSADLTVSLEAKNSDAAQTSVLDYCNIYLQIGTKSLSVISVFKLDGIQSLSFICDKITGKVWTGADDTASLYMSRDEAGYSFAILEEVATTINIQKFTAGYEAECMLGCIDDYISFNMGTDNADNPVIVTAFRYERVWFE